MKKKSYNKKAAMRTIATLLSLFILALVFVGFFALYKFKAKELELPAVDYDFSAVNTEFVLNNFLRSSVNENVKNPYPSVEGVTYADLISWTCADPKTSRNHRILETSRSSISNFFSSIYEDKWGLKIVYSSDLDVDSWAFGDVSKYQGKITRKIKGISGYKGDIGLLTANIRMAGFSSQIIACKEGGFAKVMLFTDSSGINEPDLIKKIT